MTTSSSLPKDVKYEILPEDYSEYDLSFKVIVIGDSGVGKSCLTNKATKNIFEIDYNATVGFEFFTFNVRINQKVVKLQIWDTCGQELYRSLITNFYRNSSLAILVYAINNEESFKDVDIWLKELRTHASPDVKLILIGNKIDLVNERKVSKEEGETYAKNNNINKFVEASAKEGINTQSTFIEIAYLLYKDYSQYKTFENSNVTEEINRSLESDVFKSNHRKKKKEQGCCS